MERLRVEVSVQYDTEHPHAEWSLEPDGDGEVVRYADAQRALNWERERTRETLLQAMGLQQQLATLQAQLESANVLIYKKNCALGRADTTITDLQAQLPAEMPGCTILFKECEKGHGRLTATNWIDHGCGTCTVEQLQAQLARWKEVLGEWLWNCTNLLGDYHIKTVQDFNEEVNRRIAWLMQHLDHTLPPPMTDEERDRMRKLSEDNAALQADNECKDILIESLQAQLEGLEQGCFIHHVDKEQAEMKIALLEGTIGMRATERIDLLSQLENTEAQLRQVEGERNTARHRVDELESREIDVEILQGDLDTLQARNKELDRTLADVYQQRDGLQAQLRQAEGERDALKLVNETHMKTVMKLSSIVEKSAVLAAQDAGKGVGNGL